MFVQAALSGLVLGGVYALVAAGLSLIFGVMRLINFAHGQFLMLGMYLAYWLHVLFGWNIYTTGLVVVPAMFVLGWATEALLIEPIRGADPSAHLLTTFGLGLAIENLAAIAWTRDPRAVNIDYGRLILGDIRLTVPGLVALLSSTAAIAALYWFLRHTRLGTAVRATAQHQLSAQLAGIDIRTVNALTFAIGTALVGIAAVVLVPMYFVFPEVGFVFTVIAFLVTVLGGLGSVGGSLGAGLLVGVLESLSGIYVSIELARAITFGIFIAILFLRPAGLFGQQARA